MVGVLLVCVWVAETTGEETGLGFTGRLQLDESESLIVGSQSEGKQ